MNSQQNSNINTVNDDNVQRMIDNSAAMHYSNQMTLAQNIAHRPKSTILAYKAKQEEWKVSRKFLIYSIF